MGTEPTRRVLTSDGLTLAVYEEGPLDAPTVLCVHGYPDNHHVWDGVAAELAGTFRVVRYDVRGAGRSDVPARRSDYRIDQLADDFDRVLEAVSPDRAAHVLAHDWGSIQLWDALVAERSGPRVASFTSISGPSLDAAAVWLRRAGTAPLPRVVQLLESYYIGMFLAPALPQLLARTGVIDRLVRHSAARGPRPGRPSPTEASRGRKELVNGIELYRANVPGRMRRPRPPELLLPVQVIAPTHDVHVSPALQTEAPAPYVRDLTVTVVEDSHWVVSRDPATVARLFIAFAGDVASRSSARS
ncbi:alpha/beta fold hydrolase [Nocardioides sp. SYSU DS0651]|uniref:alpha/beta fold hydrolase n=1 Tax=Nocardioides sp. SYSU DS0651 TaxID=3415955 RepID=UPI003F4B1218